ncbi:MAG: HK97 family phage prohead protease, partial [Pontixanthobacter sp.]
WVEQAREDDRGLRIIARIDQPESRPAQLLTARAATGLSFGYRARRFRASRDTRWLDDVDLFEISLVAHPLQHGARVHLIA